ncbi:hypothetical protein CORC01_08798, partial [Colletotrichum orchidophilum]
VPRGGLSSWQLTGRRVAGVVFRLVASFSCAALSMGQTIEHRCNGQEAQEISPVLALMDAAAAKVSKPAKWPWAISHVPAV